MTLLDGKTSSLKLKEQLKEKFDKLNFKAKLVIVQVGDNQASNLYIRNKLKVANELGVLAEHLKFPETISQKELLDNIEKLNNDLTVHGILVQLPLPKHINEEQVIEKISPKKDVDCFHPTNIGYMWSKRYKDIDLAPCTAKGIIELLKMYQIDLVGKHVVVIGRSNIVGKPLAALFLNENATVTICHSKTINLSQITKQADILVSAIGKPKFINSNFINKNQIVIDVGINKDEQGKLCGDVDFDNVKNIVSYITPVPGGVGPMTVIMIMQNLYNLIIDKA